MSKHMADATHEWRPVQVSVGWDRPLQGFYLLVEYVDLADDAESEYVFPNLSQSNPFPRSLDPCRDELQGLGISIPESMFEQAQLDQHRNVVNRICVHDAAGWEDLFPGSADGALGQE